MRPRGRRRLVVVADEVIAGKPACMPDQRDAPGRKTGREYAPGASGPTQTRSRTSASGQAGRAPTTPTIALPSRRLAASPPPRLAGSRDDLRPVADDLRLVAGSHAGIIDHSRDTAKIPEERPRPVVRSDGCTSHFLTLLNELADSRRPRGSRPRQQRLNQAGPARPMVTELSRRGPVKVAREVASPDQLAETVQPSAPPGARPRALRRRGRRRTGHRPRAARR